MPENLYFDRSIEFKDRSGGLRAVASPDELRLQLTGIHSAKVILRPDDVHAISELIEAWRDARVEQTRDEGL